MSEGEFEFIMEPEDRSMEQAIRSIQELSFTDQGFAIRLKVELVINDSLWTAVTEIPRRDSWDAYDVTREVMHVIKAIVEQIVKQATEGIEPRITLSWLVDGEVQHENQYGSRVPRITIQAKGEAKDANGRPT